MSSSPRPGSVRPGRLIASVTVAACAAVGTGVAAGPSSAAPTPLPAGAYIVQLRPESAVGSALNQLLAQLSIRPTALYRRVFTGFAANLNQSQVAALRRFPGLFRIDPDSVVQINASAGANARRRRRTRNNGQPAQEVPRGVARSGALQSPTAAIDGRDSVIPVDVAVVDTGIDGRHPDLRVVGGWNYWNTPIKQDVNGHGTHCAGTIAARDNGIGVVGVAPGARLWSVRVLDGKGRGAISYVIRGLEFVLSRADRIKVVNMSLGAPGADGSPFDIATRACVAAGITVVCAAGNESRDVDTSAPARFQGVMAVSALADSDGQGGPSSGPFLVDNEVQDMDESLADFSNFGAKIAVAAPGTNIRSTTKGQGYSTWSGTSMASPHVAGAAALYLATHPGASPQEVRDAILAAGSQVDFGDDRDRFREPVLDVSTF